MPESVSPQFIDMLLDHRKKLVDAVNAIDSLLGIYDNGPEKESISGERLSKAIFKALKDCDIELPFSAIIKIISQQYKVGTVTARAHLKHLVNAGKVFRIDEARRQPKYTLINPSIKTL